MSYRLRPGRHALITSTSCDPVSEAETHMLAMPQAGRLAVGFDSQRLNSGLPDDANIRCSKLFRSSLRSECRRTMKTRLHMRTNTHTHTHTFPHAYAHMLVCRAVLFRGMRCARPLRTQPSFRLTSGKHQLQGKTSTAASQSSALQTGSDRR